MNIGLGIGIPFSRSILYRALNTSLYLDFVSNETLDPKISFSRASNATVTKSDGTIGYAPHNLLTYSEQFDNASGWSQNLVTVSGNTSVAPNGTTTADKVVATAAFGAHNVASAPGVVSGNSYTFSFYAKAGEYQFASLLFASAGFGTNTLDIFNIALGLVVSNISGTATITPVGGGWYRCSATRTASASVNSTFQIRTLDSSVGNDYTGDGTSGIYIWGAQLNVGSLQPYYPTTVKNLLGYTQEFDNAAWTKSNSFVQTNLLTYSQEIDNTAWSKSNTSIAPNATVSPDGSLSADKLVEASGTISPFVAQLSSVVSGNSYTLTVYAKSVQSSPKRYLTLLLPASNFGLNKRATFDLDVGSYVTTNSPDAASIVLLKDGWYRCQVTATATVSGNVGTQYRTSNVSPDTLTNYTGDGTSGIYIWGAQLVQGSSPGDYVTTYGTTRAVMYAAPDGTMTADKAIPTTVNGDHLVSSNAGPAISGTVYSFSVYAKAAEYSFLRLSLGGVAGGGFTFFNLATGTIGTTAGMAANEIIPVGNGWYRCSVRRAASSSAGIAGDIYLTSADNQFSWTGDGTSGIYIWGAQLSDSASLDPYVYNPGAAPAASAYYGPRFDYDPVTLQPKGLLIEEQRTNLVPQSAAIDDAYWLKNNTTTTANVSLAPDGTTSGDKLVEDTGTAAHYLSQGFTPANATTYTFSVYLKSAERKFAFVGFNTGSMPTTFVSVDLTTGAVSTATGTPSNSSSVSAGNGWWRVSFNAVSTGTTGSTVDIRVSTDGIWANRSYTGDGTSGIYIWGAQLEAGAFPTSYIPTTTAAATRAADGAVMTGANFSSWYRQEEGTLFAEFDHYYSSATLFPRVVSADDGTANNAVRIGVSGATSYSGNTVVGGVTQAGLIAGSVINNTQVKVSSVYKLNDFAMAANGILGTTDSSGSIPAVSQLSIGSVATANFLNGHIRRIAYFPRRLSNAELQGITA